VVAANAERIERAREAAQIPKLLLRQICTEAASPAATASQERTNVLAAKEDKLGPVLIVSKKTK